MSRVIGMRDQFVTEEFLRERLERTHGAIELFSPALDYFLVRELVNVAKLRYCLGDPLDAVKEAFRGRVRLRSSGAGIWGRLRTPIRLLGCCGCLGWMSCGSR